jgi:U6 snRNA-associated Sm-like protein LSm7
VCGRRRARIALDIAALDDASRAMPPKESVLDLARFIDRGVRVKLSGGREVTGTLKGYDQLLNLVLDEAIEHLRDAEDALKISEETRKLGLLVCRGTSVMVVSALDSMEEIANPFLAEEEGGAI